jgi:hypothetical protein
MPYRGPCPNAGRLAISQKGCGWTYQTACNLNRVLQTYAGGNLPWKHRLWRPIAELMMKENIRLSRSLATYA